MILFNMTEINDTEDQIEEFERIYQESKYNKQPAYLTSSLDDNVNPLLHSEALFEKIYQKSHFLL